MHGEEETLSWIIIQEFKTQIKRKLEKSELVEKTKGAKGWKFRGSRMVHLPRIANKRNIDEILIRIQIVYIKRGKSAI